MKKTVFTCLVLLLATLTIITSYAASVSVNYAQKMGVKGELIITEVLSNNKCDIGGQVAGGDYSEFIEVMNISDAPIDLYNYIMWYGDGTNGNYFVCNKGEKILDPGEIAVIVLINSSNVTFQVDGDTYTYVTYNADGTRTYNIELWKSFEKNIIHGEQISILMRPKQQNMLLWIAQIH